MSGGGSYIAAGVRADCEKLLSLFIEKNSLRFNDFIEAWQGMHFSLIYCGRKTFSDLVEFTEEVLQIAKTYLFPPHSIQIRAGGVYLAAGLYYKQPTSGLVKIRFTCEDLENLNQFLEQLREEGHHDVLYMFSKLLADNAFLFTLSPRTYGIEFNIRKYLLHKPGDESLSSMRDEDSSDEEEFNPETFATDFLKKSKMLDRIQDVETRYQTMKSLLYGDKDGNLPKSLSYTSPSILEVMNSLISNKTVSSGHEESGKRKLKKDAFKKTNKTEMTKALEKYSTKQEIEMDSEDNMPSTSKKAAKEVSVQFSEEEWTATAHPKNRRQLRIIREFESRSMGSSTEKKKNKPSEPSAMDSGVLNLEEI